MRRRRWNIVLAAVAAAAARAAAEPAAASPSALPPHPRLLLDRAGVEEFRRKIADEPWRSAWNSLLRDLDRQRASRLELPPRGGNWSHNYVCPEHGARLRQGKSLGPWQWEHQCPVGPHALRGDPSEARLDFDGCAIMGVHHRLAAEARDMGVAYAVTGEGAYADRARAILLAYADRYLSYPRHDNHGRPVTAAGTGGRVASQPLSEASWLTPILHAADLIWPRLTAAERAAIETRWIRPALNESIRNPSRRPVIHNIQCHRNSAIGLAGFLLGDTDLIAEAIDGRHGYRANMAHGVQADGVWIEGAWGYHFYTLDGLWPLTEAARNCGVDLYGPELKRMFNAPLRLATPTLRLPAFNDSREVDVIGQADVYELAFARYRDPVYAGVVAASRRSGRLARWFGVPTVSGAVAAVSGSRNAEVSGYAILQKGEGAGATWLCVKYGPHGGGHGHYDKNNLVLFAGGSWVMPDPGSHAYGSPLHAGWDKTSFAHDTLVVDQRDQKQATGRCLAFGAAGGAEFAMTDAGPIADGVQFVRTALLCDTGLAVVVDHVTAAQPRALDLVGHAAGQWSGLPAGDAFSPPDLPGYRYMKDATTRRGDGGAALTVDRGRAGPLRFLLAAGEPTEVITATGVGASTADRVPLVIFRRVARQTVFVWAAALGQAPARVSARGENGGATLVEAIFAERRWRWRVDPVAARVTIAAD